MQLDETAWKVKQRAAGANMSVDIGQGTGFIDISSSYIYPAWVASADKNISVDAADVSNPRIDRVVAYIDLASISTAVTNNTGALKFKAVAGTPAGSPSAPSDGTVQSAVGSGNPYIDIGQLAVAAGATSISTANITDKRPSLGLRAPIIKKITTLTSSTTLSGGYDMVLMNASSGNQQNTLPDPTLYTGLTLTFQRIDSTVANTCRISRFGSTNISGVNDIYFPNQWDSLELYSNGTNWVVKDWSFNTLLKRATASSTQNVTGTSATALTGLSIATIVPTTVAEIELILYTYSAVFTNITTVSTIWSGTVGSGTIVGQANAISGSSHGDAVHNSSGSITPGSAGSITYNGAYQVSSGNADWTANAATPAYIEARLRSLV